MGYLHATDMASMADLDTALLWHLRSNHYPPVPASMVEPCKQAIEAYWDEDYHREIKLPDGVEFRGSTTCEASDLVRGLHLEAWLTEEDEEA